MAKLLTALAVKNLKPRDKRYSVPTGAANGLFVNVLPSGHKSYSIRYRFGGRTRNLTLNDGLTLAEARAQAGQALLEVSRGVDPAAVKVDAKAKAKLATTNTGDDSIEKHAEQFLELHARRKTGKANAKQAELALYRHALPAWRGRDVQSIRRRDIIEVIEAVAHDQGHPVMANRVLGHLSKFFSWLVARDVIAGSPCIGVERPKKEKARSRVLNDNEIRDFWTATTKLSAPFGDIYRLLLLSAARRQEVAEMRWSEVDLVNKVWRLPRERTKNDEGAALPLGPTAWAVIEAQPRIVGVDFVWGARRTGFSHFKSELDAAMQPAVPWRNHDLRRTSRTLLARAGVIDAVAERCIGHKVGSAVSQIYNQHRYVEEMRHAFAALESLIGTIISPTPAKVVTLPRRKLRS